MTTHKLKTKTKKGNTTLFWTYQNAPFWTHVSKRQHRKYGQKGLTETFDKIRGFICKLLKFRVYK